jgi:LPXTG-motif cell wall-anchored protein
MLMVFPVLPLLALSGYVTIDGVSADAANNKITVTVTTSAPVGEGDVRAKLTGSVLQLYLDEGHVRDHRRAYRSGGLEISVLKRNDYAKVEVPLADELGCAGPVTVQPGATGFAASIGCKGASVSPPEPAQETPVAAKPEAIAAAAAIPHPAAAPKAAPLAPPAPPKTITEPTVSASAAPVVAPPPAPPAPAPALTLAATMPSHGNNTLMLPLLGLVAAGGAAFMFKRRQQKQSSLIQILETAQLGPKRQLVVARINGETMVLGSSEAGITCLTGQFRVPTEGTLSSFPSMAQLAMTAAAQPAPAPAEPPPQQFVPFDPPPAPKHSGNEFVDEGGLLTRLFRARGQEKPAQKVENFENIELHEFDNLLQESIADQELRRKLSTGFSGKVS